MISAYLLANGDPFDCAAFLSFQDKTLKNRGLVENSDPALRPSDVLPIEFFKDQSLLHKFLKPGTVSTRTFFSSGTTGQVQSRSPFSQEGLENYRIESLLGFASVLRRKFADLGDDELSKIQGVSLIPSSTDWPNSSLAQMISWIADYLPVTFVGEGPNALKSIDYSKPVWMFGTAFHFVNLIDDGCKQKLAANSLIIETGGTKGRSRFVTRGELFSLISSAFSLTESRIISEYGMSELATQAYDLETCALADRWYHFPAWVTTHVLVKDGTIKKSGVGSIVISDPFRTDLPLPIRTEDIVELRDNKFQILRRSRSAPLKGCSMLAELPLQKSSFSYAQSAAAQIPKDETHLAKEVLSLCHRLLQDQSVFSQFTEEFGHKDLAKFATEDLTRSLSLSPEDLARSAKRLHAADKKSAWTIIAPNSHSLAVVHPIIIGFVAGLDLAVRVPERFTGDQHFLMQLIQGLNLLRSNSIVLIPASFHLEMADDIYKQGNVLAFGTNATLKELQRIAPGRISGYGETLAVACGDLDDVKTNASNIVRDFFSLRQAGCMSARVFVLQEKSDLDLERAVKALKDAAKVYQSHLQVDDATALNGEEIRLKLASSNKTFSDGDIAMPLVVGIMENELRSHGVAVAQKAYVIPVISTKTPVWEDFVKSLKNEFFPELPVSLILLADTPKNKEFLKDSSESSMSTLSFRAFGRSQSPTFSGFHEGRPLFSLTH